MEASQIRNLVRDLDLTLQPRIVPRYKSWLPLATQQLRLRSLVQIIGHNLKANASNGNVWFYYTLHGTSMSSPLYTSEPIDNCNPRWSSPEVPVIHATGYSTASEIILRLWKRTAVGEAVTDSNVFTWSVAFSGLAYIGPKLPGNLEAVLRENSLIFKFHGGFFTPAYCFHEAPELKRYLHIKVNIQEIKDSYTVNKLCSLKSKMQALKQQTESVQALRTKIASGENFHTPKYPQSSLNRFLQPRKVSREKKAEIMRIRKELEMARFRTKLLEQERGRKLSELRALTQLHTNIIEENQDHGSDLMERYRELNKDIERLHEWRQTHIDKRETYVQLGSQLAHRRRQLISELHLIYPITQDSGGKFRINDVHLPDSEDLELSNDTEVAVALGFVAHTAQMVANFLNVPTRYPIIHYGSRSKVIDHITENLPDNERQFPLFARSKDKLQFRYAVYLLNKNIAQLRWYCGLPTTDLRAMLPNLATLVNIKPHQTHLDNSKRTLSTSSLDIDLGNGKHNAPLTPPIQKLIFEKCHRSTRSISQLKGIKSSLGSSLDQGLDKPVPQSLLLSSQSKRICKSEESAIDNKTLILAKADRSSNSSNETLNSAILSNMPGNRNIEQQSSPQPSNDIMIESNIEIVIPTSVSKSATNVADSLESSVSVRDRSSNSISSCEMALSGSQNDVLDVAESTHDNQPMRREGTEESVPLITESLQSFKDVIDNAIRNGEAGENLNSDRDALLRPERQTAAAVDPTADRGKEERFGKSCLSLNDITSCTCDGAERKHRTSSICSYSAEEECFFSREQTAACPQHSTNGKGDRPPPECKLESGSWSPPEMARDPTSDLELAQKTDCYPFDEKGKPCDYQTSSEYIDIIRRSSENVYARTEALVNKKTSFKVMKPRL